MGLLSGVASIAGAFLGARASDRAANAQVAGLENATAEQRRQYDQTRKDLMPFYNMGLGSNRQLAYLMGINPADLEKEQGGTASAADPYANINKNIGEFGSLTRNFSEQDFQADPGYDFRMKEAMKALERSASARGAINSGQSLKAINNYAQDAASQEYNNAYNRYVTNQTSLYNRLAGLGTQGQTAANQITGAGQNAANQISSNMAGQGVARSAGIMGAANAWSTGLNNAVSSFGGDGGRVINTAGGLPWLR